MSCTNMQCMTYLPTELCYCNKKPINICKILESGLDHGRIHTYTYVFLHTFHTLTLTLKLFTFPTRVWHWKRDVVIAKQPLPFRQHSSWTPRRPRPCPDLGKSPEHGGDQSTGPRPAHPLTRYRKEAQPLARADQWESRSAGSQFSRQD